MRFAIRWVFQNVANNRIMLYLKFEIPFQSIVCVPHKSFQSKIYFIQRLLHLTSMPLSQLFDIHNFGWPWSYCFCDVPRIKRELIYQQTYKTHKNVLRRAVSFGFMNQSLNRVISTMTKYSRISNKSPVAFFEAKSLTRRQQNISFLRVYGLSV